jgi:hypothetical protein
MYVTLTEPIKQPIANYRHGILWIARLIRFQIYSSVEIANVPITCLILKLLQDLNSPECNSA